MDPADASQKIIRAFRLAEADTNVEVGCSGGVGRTGTVLACMAVLAGMVPAEAVQWVRDTYNFDAVETDEQTQWVKWFAGYAQSVISEHEE